MNEAENTQFKDRAFEGDDCVETIFISCQFEKCNFSQTSFRNAQFRDCSFTQCSMQQTNVSGCRFQNVTFSNCKIVAVEFHHSDKKFLSLIFEQCVLMGCNFSEMVLKKASFQDSKVTECFFNETQLQEANFQDADLSKSIFHHANLTKANFQGAINYAIDPQVNQIQEAHFSMPEAMALLNYLNVNIG